MLSKGSVHFTVKMSFLHQVFQCPLSAFSAYRKSMLNTRKSSTSLFLAKQPLIQRQSRTWLKTRGLKKVKAVKKIQLVVRKRRLLRRRYNTLQGEEKVRREITPPRVVGRGLVYSRSACTIRVQKSKLSCVYFFQTPNEIGRTT